ncbi:DUF106 domain-containing protein [Patescibacteria group bacterium]|nr:DUF106 domain-containing protein [Patescibacteria group bacterium]
MGNQKKEGRFRSILLVFLLVMLIALFWDSIPILKDTVSALLDPTAGALLRWNLEFGMMLIVMVITILTTFVQKYLTDQNAMREMKKEQKELQEEMKKYKEHPEKLMELQKKQMEFIPKMLKVSFRGTTYTMVPFVLFFRWFSDYFVSAGNPKFFGIFTWFWFYFLFSIIISSILRKIMKVV